MLYQSKLKRRSVFFFCLADVLLLKVVSKLISFNWVIILSPWSHLASLEVLFFHQSLLPSAIPGPAHEGYILRFKFTAFNQN